MAVTIMENEYLKQFQALWGEYPPGATGLQRRLMDRPMSAEALERYGPFGHWKARRDMVRRFSFSVPNEEALDALRGLSPLVSIGAGTGYWEALMRARGATVHAYDKAPPCGGGTTPPLPPPGYASWRDFVNNAPDGTPIYEAMEEAGVNSYHFDFPCWTPVLRGGPECIEQHQDCTLFLSWPPMDDMATECLKLYTGSTVAYVGEWGGCTATPEFRDLLEKDFEVVKEVDLPQWWGIHDYLSVWRRKK